MRFVFIIICLVILFASCTDKYDCRWKIKEDCRDSIEAYISSHQEYPSFLIVLKHEISEQTGVVTNGFFVGPLYEQSRLELHSALPVVINNAKVYILSDLQYLLESPEMTSSESSQYSFILDYNKEESAPVNYIRCAVYMYYDENRLIVNTRPDTLFLPKLVEDSTIIDEFD